MLSIRSQPEINLDMDIEKIKEITAVVEASSITEFKYEDENIKLEISKVSSVVTHTVAAAPQLAAQPASAPQPAAPATAQPASPPEESNIHVITAPLVGTFYGSPSPESSSFIHVGERVKKGDTICIIEAMKLMNEIEADVDGEVIAVLAANATPVEFGSPLFKIKKS